MKKVAVIHDWLTGMRGGEKVLEEILKLYPQAEIFTLICNPEKVSALIRSHKIHTSFLQGVPGIFKSYRNFLPLFPAAIESFNLKNFDTVISSSHCVAKGVKAPDPKRHICYCHTPMRYAWDQFGAYFSPERTGRLKFSLISAVMPGLRKWDVRSAGRAGHYIANSNHVRKRIEKYYGRSADVLYPPVDTEFYTPGGEKGDFYLMVSALNEYKRPDLCVEAFAQMPERKLKVIGSGPLLEGLKKGAPANVEFLGYKSNDEIRENYRKAKAFLFPGEEDFGITMAEAASCGTPVIALDRGGSLEIVIEGKTGEFFDGSVEGLIKTIEKREKRGYDVKEMRASGLRFSAENFRKGFMNIMEKAGIK